MNWDLEKAFRQRNFVGEAAYHYDEERKIHICDVIVLAKYRNRGFGSTGIRLLGDAAKENGISVLYDDIAADNASYKLFLKNGFEIDYQDNTVVMVKKTRIWHKQYLKYCNNAAVPDFLSGGENSIVM